MTHKPTIHNVHSSGAWMLEIQTETPSTDVERRVDSVLTDVCRKFSITSVR